MFGFGNLNKWQGIGNCGEIKTRGSGDFMAFGVAVNSRVKDGDDYRDEVTWVNVVAFGKTAELGLRFIEKGKKVYVEGRLQTRKWQDSDGNDRYTTEVIAYDLQLLDSKGESSQPAAQKEASPAAVSEEDVPF